MSFNLGFIGGGNMSTAIVKGILIANLHPANKIWVAGPHVENLTEWCNLGTYVTNKNGEVFCNCEIIFLGVKPKQLKSAIDDISKSMPNKCEGKHVLFVSMLAGVSIDELHKALSVLSENVRVIRIMPNTPATVGAGACLLCPDPYVVKEQSLMVERLLSGCGVVEKVSEYLMESLGSLVGCGPAFIYIIIEALADGAVKQGSPRSQALKLAAQVVMGSGLMVLQTGKHPGELKDEVCSPGGTTIAGVAELEDGKIRSILMKAIEAASMRYNDLRKEACCAKDRNKLS